jgi:beta-glucosidase
MKGSKKTRPLYKEPSKPVDERVKDLLKRMTIEEKILQLTSIWLSLT